MELNTRITGSTEKRFEDYLEDQPEDTSAYQANRELIDDGLRYNGYHPTESSPESALERFVNRLATGFAISGLILTGMSFTGQSGVQAYTIVVFALAITLYAANRFAGERLESLEQLAVGGGESA